MVALIGPVSVFHYPYQRQIFKQMSNLVASKSAETGELLSLAKANNDEILENIYLKHRR